MRLSVNPEDRGYATWRALPRGVRPRVVVDGAEIKRCVTADDRVGYVLQVAADADGNVLLNAKRTNVLLRQIRGRVTIELEKVA
jgi:uncharacterized membrane protein